MHHLLLLCVFVRQSLLLGGASCPKEKSACTVRILCVRKLAYAMKKKRRIARGVVPDIGSSSNSSNSNSRNTVGFITGICFTSMNLLLRACTIQTVYSMSECVCLYKERLHHGGVSRNDSVVQQITQT